MARPRAADPKKAITLRLPASVLDRWEDAANRQEPPRSLREHLEFKLVEAAQVGGPAGPRD